MKATGNGIIHERLMAVPPQRETHISGESVADPVLPILDCPIGKVNEADRSVRSLSRALLARQAFGAPP